jgi:hypothetical protein
MRAPAISATSDVLSDEPSLTTRTSSANFFAFKMIDPMVISSLKQGIAIRTRAWEFGEELI